MEDQRGNLESNSQGSEEGILNLGKLSMSLIFLISIIFLIQLAVDLVPLFGFNFALISQRPWTILTATFLHSSFLHLAYNLFAIFFFSNALEIHKGWKTVVLVFVFSVIVGNLGFAIFSPNTYAIGASGFVYGLIGASVTLLPNIEIPFPIGYVIIPLPIKYAGPLLALGQFVLTFAKQDNIAHSAHFFGFFAGVFIGLFRRFT